MKQYRSQGVIINNFFTLATIILMSAVIAIYMKYIVKEKPRIHSNLQCQKEIYSTDKVFNQKYLDKMAFLISQGRYELDGGILESIYMKSKIKNTIQLNEIDKFFIEALDILPLNTDKTVVQIRYELIENDKMDKRKKSDECKLNAGSLKTSFRVNGRESFRMYTDFMSYNKQEIKQRVQCTIKAFKSNESKN